MKNVLFIVGSMREQSFNRQLAKVAEEMLKGKCNVKYLDYSDLPYMNQDLEMPVQPAVARVREEVKNADALWIFTPEYNFSYPGVLKNLLDWLSRQAHLIARLHEMDLMHEPQTGIALGLEAWTKSEFALTDEQRAELQKQAEAFCSFVRD